MLSGRQLKHFHHHRRLQRHKRLRHRATSCCCYCSVKFNCRHSGGKNTQIGSMMSRWRAKSGDVHLCSRPSRRVFVVSTLFWSSRRRRRRYRARTSLRKLTAGPLSPCARYILPSLQKQKRDSPRLAVTAPSVRPSVRRLVAAAGNNVTLAPEMAAGRRRSLNESQSLRRSRARSVSARRLCASFSHRGLHATTPRRKTDLTPVV